ncbi:methylmalonyl-CoA mutase family protein [uncultured Jatrophihabitans sp.]|uniref:methylmalonyl-CoA mutase family protein n=1 Tax=uncultured Jatrophihabitans sp. TaxID=1610747 RepID=UPI0035CBEE3C
MPAEPDRLALAADFPAPTRAQWRELVAGVLAKSGVETDDPEAALAYRTYDGIEIDPLYTADDAPEADGVPGAPPFVRGATAQGATVAGWDVCTLHAGRDATQVNRAVLDDLERGATSTWLVLGGAGLPVDELGRALDGVYLDLAPVVLDAGVDTAAAARAYMALAAGRDVPAGELSGSFGADPIGLRARTGAAADVGSLADLVTVRGDAPGLRIATADGTVFHDAGASDAQELGLATSVGVAYLRALVDAGLSVDDALAAIDFRWAVTAEQFPSIAKLRAARRVWDRVAELSGAAADRCGQRQHAVTSAAMMTRRDPWVNMLRTTVACFSAAVGGADAITVAPFDSAIGQSDDFARRIARNTHAVLHDESSLARVLDAAGGSWFVESLTDELADAAWTVFTDVEKNGGVLARLDDGTVDTFLAPIRSQRHDDIAHRRAPITGVSEYAFVAEQPVDRPALAQPVSGLLPSLRWAHHYEVFRDRADAAPQRPTVFLAALGTQAQYSARSGFATNLFAAGGVETVTGSVEDFAAAGTSVACICGPDKLYADQADATAQALRDAGATLIWLAGKHEAAGVDGYLSVGCDVFDALGRTFEALGIGR